MTPGVKTFQDSGGGDALLKGTDRTKVRVAHGFADPKERAHEIEETEFEQQEQRVSFTAGEREVGVARQPVGRVAVEEQAGDSLAEEGLEAVAEGPGAEA